MIFPEFDEYVIQEIDQEEEDLSFKKVLEYDFDKKDFIIRDKKMAEASYKKAIWQWLAFLVSTQINKYQIYNDFGIEIDNYIGSRERVEFIGSEIKRQIEEKLELNKQIDGISNFELKRDNGRIEVSFLIHTIRENEIEFKEVI